MVFLLLGLLFFRVFFYGVSFFLQEVFEKNRFIYFYFVFFFSFFFPFPGEFKGWNICPSINQGPIRTKATLNIVNLGDPITLIHSEALPELTLNPAVPVGPPLLPRSLLIVGNE